MGQNLGGTKSTDPDVEGGRTMVICRSTFKEMDDDVDEITLPVLRRGG